MNRQTGVTMSGMMLFVLLLILILYAASRIVPAYMDDWIVAHQLKELAAQPNIQNQSDESIRNQFAKQLSLNNITRVTRDDLQIDRVPGAIHLSAEFSAKEPFLGAVSLCMDFRPQAGPPIPDTDTH